MCEKKYICISLCVSFAKTYFPLPFPILSCDYIISLSLPLSLSHSLSLPLSLLLTHLRPANWQLKLTPEYLELMRLTAIANNTKIFFGPNIPTVLPMGIVDSPMYQPTP